MSRAVTDESRVDGEETPIAKRILIGEPLTSEKLDEQLLPKKMALPIFASDALSSVAYAPQELLMILLIGGTALLTLSPWVAVAVVVLLIVVVLSYRQLIKAYPSGGGDYEVASKNLGEVPGVVWPPPCSWTTCSRSPCRWHPGSTTSSRRCRRSIRSGSRSRSAS